MGSSVAGASKVLEAFKRLHEVTRFGGALDTVYTALSEWHNALPLLPKSELDTQRSGRDSGCKRDTPSRGWGTSTSRGYTTKSQT